ncbi:MAG: exosortase E/protease, VPEID-CTERM system, partial [Steroidobacteraceae bacterium]
TYMLYRQPVTEISFAAIVGAWVIVGSAAALAAMLAMSPATLWVALARGLGMIWWYAAVAAFLGAAAMQLSQRLWVPAATLTFDLVRLLLSPILPSLTADPSTLVLRTSRFAVQVAEVCSGLEGVGLVLVFSAAWLIYFRREYLFPRALLLIPAGVVAIFAFNVLRISALVLIGNAGFPDVAVYGFHSQAGWIAFNVVACGLVFLSRRSSWLNRTAAQPAQPTGTHNPTAAYLMPLLAILGAGALSHAMSGRFEALYPLRLLAGLGALAAYRHKLLTLDWRWSWRGPATGVCIFILWISCAHILTPAAPMPGPLTAASPAARGLWMAARVAVSVLIVPLAEELAYRGYLMRRLMQQDFESLPFQSIRWPALAATAGLFGLAHGALWLPGIAAGLVYGLIVVRRGSLGEAVAAHATTNALIAVSVLHWGQWQLW